MPEILRSIASRLREFVGNRRRAPRFRVRLPVVVSLLDAKANSSPPTVTGQTCDASTSGLGLILPNIRIGGRYLVGDALTLRVTLKLPDGTHARLYGTPVRYERLEEDQADKGFLVGVRITDTDERDRAALADFLKTLRE